MIQRQQRLELEKRKEHWWLPYLIDAAFAIMAVVLVTALIFALQLQTRITTIALAYLFIVLWLVHKRGLRTAILAALVACMAFDFFFFQPIFSFSIAHIEEGIDLFIFLLFAIILGYFYSGQQKRVERTKQQKYEATILYEEKLHKQTEEASRRDHEIDTFYEVVRATIDEKDLRYQLSLITHAIEETLAFCGVRGCLIYLPDLDGKPSLQTLPTQSTNGIALTSDEDASIMWVMKYGKSILLSSIPLITRAKGNYLRRVVASNTMDSFIEHGYSYIAPLKVGQNVVGVIRILIEDETNHRVIAIKHFLEAEREVSQTQPELFSKLLDYAKLLIGEALIERALMQQECLRKELQLRTEELHDAIISSVSHDFHTPLTLIKGAASSLLDQGMLLFNDAEQRHTLEAIVSEANWLERILMRMLDLSRIEKGTLKLEKELYPIDEIILNTLELGHMRSLIQGRHIEKNVPDELPSVEVDPILLCQVLVNLVENAIRYTPADSPIEINVRTDGEKMLISVADRGPGIPTSDLENIFEKFYRVTRKVDVSKDEALALRDQGSGLGLAVCRGFVIAHGGRIWVENRDGGGANFQFTLPLTGKRDRR